VVLAAPFIFCAMPRAALRADADLTCYVLQSIPVPEAAYVGFSRYDVNVRLRQHNGELPGGAKATIEKRPWRLVAFVSGFPKVYDALCFEYAWQNPRAPVLMMTRVLRRRCLWPNEDVLVALNELRRRTRKFVLGRDRPVYSLRVLEEMLQIREWARMPLLVCYV
jgi:predicted GIY-YIG superfamily endonuclease